MRKPLYLLLVVAALAVAAAFSWRPGASSPEGTASIGGSFRLVDQNGAEVSDSQFQGNLMLVFFGFTHCPDVCPGTLANLSAVLQQLGANSAEVAPLFITVDPARDTSARLKEYLAEYHPAIRGLTGTEAEVQRAVDAYKAYAARGEGDDSDYLMQHSGYIYLMDRDGRYVTHFTPTDSSETIVQRLKPYL